jgi:hypothetical protein
VTVETMPIIGNEPISTCAPSKNLRVAIMIPLQTN